MNLPAVFAGTVAVPDGRIFVISGFGPYCTPRRLTNAVRVYDPGRDAWAEASPIPTPRGSPAAAVGRDDSKPGNGLSTVEAYDPATDTWAAMAPMPTHRHALAATLGPDGRIYAVGGTNERVFSTDALEIYDPVRDAWAR